jgi:hypothetical protein
MDSIPPFAVRELQRIAPDILPSCEVLADVPDELKGRFFVPLAQPRRRWRLRDAEREGCTATVLELRQCVDGQQIVQELVDLHVGRAESIATVLETPSVVELRA